MPASNYKNVPDYPETSTAPSYRSREAMNPADDIVDYLKCYAREKPEMAALWCFGIGFCLGWKLKPW